MERQTADLGSDFQTGNSALALQSDGKIVVAGYTLSGTNNDFEVARFNTNGSHDITFDNDGTLTTDFTSSDDYAGSVAIQSDDKIVVAGYSKPIHRVLFAGISWLFHGIIRMEALIILLLIMES